MEVRINPYQDRFLFSEKRFPAMVSAIGTGKSMMLLLKIWNYCEKYPNSLALIVRKEFTDLRDSTIKDFETYFGKKIDTNKEYKFPNGSVIMFRHGGEIAVLKNMNLSIAGIEQAEEFDTDEVFTFIRDRLRRQNAPYRQLCLIANANGHNWIWRIFISGADNVEVMDERTGQIVRTKGGEYQSIEANTLANEHNLPKDFIEDLMRMKDDAPNHFQQYVMNNHEEVDSDDLLFKHREIYDAPTVTIPYENRTIKRVGGTDVARFGKDETVFSIIEQKDLYRWEQIFMERHKGKDTVWISGYCMELERRFNLDLNVIDDIGVGGGVTDNLKANNNRILPFIANSTVTASKQNDYINCNDEGFLMIKDLVEKQWLKLLPDHEQAEQLMSIRYTYKRLGGKLVKHMLTKEEMRVKHKEIKSPDIAKALMMAVWGTDKRAMEYEGNTFNLPNYGLVDNDVEDKSRRDEVPNYHTELPTYGKME
jgi:hypothetical protein